MYFIIGAAGALFGATALLMYKQYVTGKIQESNEKLGLDPPDTTSTKVTRELSKLREALEGQKGGSRCCDLRDLRDLRGFAYPSAKPALQPIRRTPQVRDRHVVSK